MNHENFNLVIGVLRAGRPDHQLLLEQRDSRRSSGQQTATEYRMLAKLSGNAGRVLTYGLLWETVYGDKGGGDICPMRTILDKLRRKLGEDARNSTYIFTETGVG